MNNKMSRNDGEIFVIRLGKWTTWRISQSTGPAQSKRTLPASTPVLAVYIYIYINIHTDIHTYIHACMHACIHTYIHTYALTCINKTFTCSYMIYVYLCVYIYIYIYALLRQVPARKIILARGPGALVFSVLNMACFKHRTWDFLWFFTI